MEQKNFFLFDSHSRNSLDKVAQMDGTATVIKFKARKALESVIFQNYLPETCENIQFDLQYLSISIENKNPALETYKLNKSNKRAPYEALGKGRKRKATPELWNSMGGGRQRVLPQDFSFHEYFDKRYDSLESAY